MLNHMHHDVADGIEQGKKATTLNFDDIDVSAFQGAAFMPAGYGGLTWSADWVVANSAEWYQTNPYPNSGWFSGITSGEQIAWNNAGVPVEITAKSFNIESFELTAAWDKKMSVEIVAYSHGDIVYDETVIVGDKKPTLIELGLKGIDDLVLTPTEIKVDPKAGGGSGSFMVIDDMVVSRVKSLASAIFDSHHGGDQLVATHAVGGHALPHPDIGHVCALA